MSKEQTAVDFLIEQLTSIGQLEIPKGSNVVTSIIEQAKELFKQQIIDARTPIISFLNQIEQQELRNEAEQYFNQTYKTESNGK